MIAAGIGVIILIAIVVGIVDAVQAPVWRQIAAERRQTWEARQPGAGDGTAAPTRVGRAGDLDA